MDELVHGDLCPGTPTSVFQDPLRQNSNGIKVFDDIDKPCLLGGLLGLGRGGFCQGFEDGFPVFLEVETAEDGLSAEIFLKLLFVAYINIR